MSDSPTSPDAGIEPVGAILARWRKRLKIPGQTLADRVGMSQAKISRLETGAKAPNPSEVRTVAQGLELPETEVERLVELAEQAGNQLSDWRPTQAGIADRQHDIRNIEATAKEHRVFQPALMPGLLQTSEYARAVMMPLQTEIADDLIADSPKVVAEAVAARMQRNEVLLRPDRQFFFLLAESVLRYRVSGPVEMLGQIQRLREVAAQDNVTLCIVPDDHDWPIAPYHGFYVADQRCVLVDLFDTGMMSRDRRIVRHYRRVFDAIARNAVDDVGPLLDKHQRVYARLLQTD